MTEKSPYNLVCHYCGLKVTRTKEFKSYHVKCRNKVRTTYKPSLGTRVKMTGIREIDYGAGFNNW